MKPWILWLSAFLSLSPSAFGLDLLVTGEMAGEIRPCGCSVEGQRGGIERLSAYLKSQKSKTRLWVDLGNYTVEPTAQGVLKNNLYTKLFRENRLFALLPGPNEFSTGKRGIAKRRAPYLLTNHQGVMAYTERVKHRSGWQFFGYLSPSYLSRGSHQSRLLENPATFLERVKKLRSKEWKGALLFRGSRDELLQFEASGLFGVILVANLAKSDKEQVLRFKTSKGEYHSPPLQGQGVLRYNLDHLSGQTAWLGPKSPLDPAWKKPFADYDKKVENLFMDFLAKQGKGRDKRVYKGSAYCITCHKQAGDVWLKTQHAQAYSSLENAGRQHDPDCIGCHTQGFRKGGFLSKELSAGLENVGCENCHGLTPEGHGQDKEYKAKRKRVSPLICKSCHMGNHSPRFRFETYFQKIKH